MEKAAQERMAHGLCLEDREKLTLTGVREVLSFEEDRVLMKTDLGLLEVRGQALKLRALAPDGGKVTVWGKISSLAYGEPRGKGLFGR